MDELEKEGVALLKKYGFVLRANPQVRAFLIKVGARLGWVDFVGHL